MNSFFFFFFYDARADFLNLHGIAKDKDEKIYNKLFDGVLLLKNIK
jgi:hypothetical protein